MGGARWEDFGQAPLEALADGALLATVPSGGPFEALGLARELGRRARGSLDRCRWPGCRAAAAFEMPEREVRAYRERAAGLLEPFDPARFSGLIERDVLPALLDRGGASPR